MSREPSAEPFVPSAWTLCKQGIVMLALVWPLTLIALVLAWQALSPLLAAP